MSSPTASRVAAIQMASRPGRVRRNLEVAETLIEQAAAEGSKLVVLPEFFATGAGLTKDQYWEIAEESSAYTLDFLTSIAAKLDVALVAGIVSAGEGRTDLYDEAVAVSPDGSVVRHRKAILWDREREVFSIGDGTPVVAQTTVGTVGLAICYEASFPELCRLLALEGADILAVPAAFGMQRRHAWEMLTRSRALENGCHLIAANQTGGPRRGEFAGRSGVFGPRGQELAYVRDGEGVISSFIRPEAAVAARAEIPYLEQARKSWSIRIGDRSVG